MEFAAWMSKLRSTCPKEEFVGVFVKKNTIFSIFFAYWANTFGRFSKFFRRVVKSAFNNSKITIWVIFPLRKQEYSLYLVIQRGLFAFCGNFSIKCLKITLHVSKGTYGKILSENFFFQFWILMKTSRHFVEFFPEGLSKIHFFASRRTTQSKEVWISIEKEWFHSFLSIERKFMDFLAKYFQQTSQNCILLVQKKLSREKILFKTKGER